MAVLFIEKRIIKNESLVLSVAFRAGHVHIVYILYARG